MISTYEDIAYDVMHGKKRCGQIKLDRSEICHVRYSPDGKKDRLSEFRTPISEFGVAVRGPYSTDPLIYTSRNERRGKFDLLYRYHKGGGVDFAFTDHRGHEFSSENGSSIVAYWVIIRNDASTLNANVQLTLLAKSEWDPNGQIIQKYDKDYVYFARSFFSVHGRVRQLWSGGNDGWSYDGKEKQTGKRAFIGDSRVCLPVYEPVMEDSFPESDDTENEMLSEEEDPSDDGSGKGGGDGPELKLSTATTKNRKAADIDEIASQISRYCHARSVNDKLLYAYDDSTGRYIAEPKIETLLDKLLRSPGVINHLTNREVTAVAERMLWLSKNQTEICDFNNHDDLINTEECVFNLITGERTEHSPDYLFSYSIKARILPDDEKIRTPVFDKYCADAFAPGKGTPPDEAKAAIAQSRKLLLQFMGYCLSDCSGGKAALVLRGKSDSGKSLILDFLTDLLGQELVTSIPFHALGEKFQAIDMLGKKLCVSGEVNGNKMSPSSMDAFKKITGGDLLHDSYKSKDGISFRVRCKLVYAANDLPEVSGDTDSIEAFINRLRILAFPNRIAREKRDPKLKEKLWLERDGIVTLAIRELRELRANNFIFVEPETSTRYLERYKQGGDPLMGFLDECCVIESGRYIKTGKLFEAYRERCRQAGATPLGKTKFGEKIVGIDGVSRGKPRIDGHQFVCFKGISLKES